VVGLLLEALAVHGGDTDMFDLLCIIFLLISYLTWRQRDYKQERLLAQQAEINARIALLMLTLEEEERAYQCVLEKYR